MAYEARNFESLIGCEGLTENLMRNHFTLYQGYVKNTNALLESIATKATGTPERAELQRRLGWEFNGMRLHELFFGNLSRNGVGAPPEELRPLLDDFTAIASMRGIGWAMMYFDPTSGNMLNVWVNEHDAGHLAGCVPLLVLDVFEHAYLNDYGLRRPDYIAAFMKLIDWNAVNERLLAARRS